MIPVNLTNQNFQNSSAHDQWKFWLNRDNAEKEANAICDNFKQKLLEIPVPEIQDVQKL